VHLGPPLGRWHPDQGPSNLPNHLVADEKHTWLEGEKVYVATTAAGGSILGAELAESASADALEKAYGVFAAEARLLDEDYAPETVCTAMDGMRRSWPGRRSFGPSP
jgi:hypothetical protein